MKYVIADIERVMSLCGVDLYARHKCGAKVMLNEKDLSSVPGETIEEKVININGLLLTENEAVAELNKKSWI